MQIFRRDRALVATALLASALLWAFQPRATRGPRSVQDVHRIAGAAGLYFRPDPSEIIGPRAAFVGDRPVTADEAARRRFSDKTLDEWVGKVFVWERPEDGGLLSPEPDKQWGDVYLYGDPALISFLLELHGD